MADIRKVEEGNAFSEKCKLDLPNPMNELKQKADGKESESESNKRQKLDTGSENETNTCYSFLISGKMVEAEDGKEDSMTNEDNHLEAEPEIVHRVRRFTAAEKGKGILIEGSDEEGDHDDNSSNDSDSDFSDGFDSGLEDIPF